MIFRGYGIGLASLSLPCRQMTLYYFEPMDFAHAQHLCFNHSQCPRDPGVLMPLRRSITFAPKTPTTSIDRTRMKLCLLGGLMVPGLILVRDIRALIAQDSPWGCPLFSQPLFLSWATRLPSLTIQYKSIHVYEVIPRPPPI